jgi:hypothetical protein
MGGSMYSTAEFAALEIMCRERATLAKKAKEFAEAEYWLAEAENGSNSRTHVLGALPSISEFRKRFILECEPY